MTLRSLSPLAVLSLLGLASAGCTTGGPKPCEGPGCTAPDAGEDTEAEAGSLPDGGEPDAPGGYDAEPVDPCNPACGPEEGCGEDGAGDGLDNNCDGAVDEGCVCAGPGATRSCFLGPPDRANLGSCSEGVMSCTEFLAWGPCTGGQGPVDEICDGADNDCDGSPDDGLTGCSTSLLCPGSELAQPLTAHPLAGSSIFTGVARTWSWSIECPDTVSPCPAPEDPTTADTQIFFVSSGNYRARLEVETDSGDELSCDWVIRVQGRGLRVELNWDTRGSGNGDTDVDLHLHRKSVPPGITTGESEWYNDDDCYYANCKGSYYSEELEANWDLPASTDITLCQDAPHGEGQSWVERGSCANPRLDVDVVFCDPAVTDPMSGNFCAPENINIDDPPVGQPVRVMVNYFSSHGHAGKTYPTVNVYCGGELRAALNTDRAIALQDGTGGDNWLVADVVFRADECGGVTCDVVPLNMLQSSSDFGPPWSF